MEADNRTAIVPARQSWCSRFLYVELSRIKNAHWFVLSVLLSCVLNNEYIISETQARRGYISWSTRRHISRLDLPSGPHILIFSGHTMAQKQPHHHHLATAGVASDRALRNTVCRRHRCYVRPLSTRILLLVRIRSICYYAVYLFSF